MKLIDTLIFSFAILMLLIGIHQAMMYGFMAGYWLFMLCLMALLWYQIRKKNQKKAADEEAAKEGKTAGNPGKKRKYKI